MAERLDDEDLLSLLQQKEDAAAHFVHGELASAREQAMREYHRMPYGNEVDSEATIVSSDVQDSVEWILPALLKTFSATDKAVAFEPSRASDVQGAEQADRAGGAFDVLNVCGLHDASLNRRSGPSRQRCPADASG